MKYFIVSDIHSFYSELEKALLESGYDKKNKNHTLVIVGDLFDRGDKPLELFNFITSIPKKRLILIRGNHEDIFVQLANSPFPDETDYHNGTVETFCRIVGYDYEKLTYEYWNDLSIKTNNYDIDPDEMIYQAWKYVCQQVKDSDVYKLIKSEVWKDYYEIGNYICTHGFIPLRYGEYDPSWRVSSTESEWTYARWSYGFEEILKGNFDEEYENEKILVCGHVASSIVREEMDGFFDEENYDIYANEKMISIDSYTVVSGVINVLVLDKDENDNVTVEFKNGR